MVSLKSFAVLGLATLTLAQSAVIDLIPDNFDKLVLKSGKPALVEFFAPWCGHCKTLAPVYEQLAQDFSFAKDKVTIAKVDADAEKTLGKRFGVQGFPTIKYLVSSPRIRRQLLRQVQLRCLRILRLRSKLVGIRMSSLLSLLHGVAVSCPTPPAFRLY
jgi:protein disulfide-isomerase-like protein